MADTTVQVTDSSTAVVPPADTSTVVAIAEASTTVTETAGDIVTVAEQTPTINNVAVVDTATTVLEVPTQPIQVVEQTPTTNNVSVIDNVTTIVEAPAAQGPPGGGGGSDAHFEFNQAVPSATWTIPHNLGKMPAVTVVDSAGDVVIGSIHYTDTDHVDVIFQAAFSGKAYLN